MAYVWRNLWRNQRPQYGSFGTAIDLYGPVFQLVAHSAMTAVQFPAKRDCLKFF